MSEKTGYKIEEKSFLYMQKINSYILQRNKTIKGTKQPNQ